MSRVSRYIQDVLLGRRMTSTALPVPDYRSRFKELQISENRKDILIEDLLATIDSLTGHHHVLKSDLDTEREARRRLQRTISGSQPVQKRFALLVIHLDADAFIFDDNWMRDPAEGGETMVTTLQEKTLAYVSSLTGDTTGVEVIIKVYGDLFQLWQRYEEGGSNLGSSDLTRFFSHFNRCEPLVDFMDIGPRMESIEQKLRGVLDYHLSDERCEHIIIAVPYTSIDSILSDQASLSSPSNPDRIAIIPQRFTSTRLRKSYDTLAYPTTSIFHSLFTDPPHHKVRKKHTRSPPPAAPAPPPAANVPKLRIRGGLAKPRDRSVSPPRLAPLLRAPSPPPAFGHSASGAPAMGMSMGTGMVGPVKWGPMQIARVQPPGRVEFQRGMVDGGGIPSLRWP